jgi:hypothetical protein
LSGAVCYIVIFALTAAYLAPDSSERYLFTLLGYGNVFAIHLAREFNSALHPDVFQGLMRWRLLPCRPFEFLAASLNQAGEIENT